MKKDFAGYVEVYDKKFYVDTRTGEGVDRVLKKIDPLLSKMASKTYMPGYYFDDIKQDLALITIDGIKSYDPEKSVKLSTFLHIHVRNKLISKIRSKNKMSKDAYFLEEDLEESGDKNSSSNNNGDFTKIKRAREEVLFTQIKPKNYDGSEESYDVHGSISDSDSMYSSDFCEYQNIDFLNSLDKLSSYIDEKTFTIIKLICVEDYTIKDAAEKVGLSGWAASMRLKNLYKNKIIKSLLNKKWKQRV